MRAEVSGTSRDLTCRRGGRGGRPSPENSVTQKLFWSAKEANFTRSARFLAILFDTGFTMFLLMMRSCLWTIALTEGLILPQASAGKFSSEKRNLLTNSLIKLAGGLDFCADTAKIFWVLFLISRSSLASWRYAGTHLSSIRIMFSGNLNHTGFLIITCSSQLSHPVCGDEATICFKLVCFLFIAPFSVKSNLDCCFRGGRFPFPILSFDWVSRELGLIVPIESDETELRTPLPIN